jgi:hypothetical protein
MKIGASGAMDSGVRTEMKTKIALLIITMDFHAGLHFCLFKSTNASYERKLWTYERIIVLIAGFWHQHGFLCLNG